MFQKSIFQKQPQRNYDNQCTQSFYNNKSNYSNIAQLQKKLQSLVVLDEIQQDILNQINRNTQRLDNLISKVRGVMKLEPIKDVKQKSRTQSFATYLPSPIQSQVKPVASRLTGVSQGKVQTQKHNLRLKDRVEKALQQQNQSVSNLPKTKYIK